MFYGFEDTFKSLEELKQAMIDYIEYHKHGQPLEVIAKQFIEAKFIRPKVRPYQTNNYYAVLMRQAWAEQEVQRIVCSEKQKKTDRTQRNGSAGHSDKAGEKADSLCH